MITNDFFSFLNNDLEEAENMRMVKEQEEEKAMFSVSIWFVLIVQVDVVSNLFTIFREENPEKNVERFVKEH